MPCRGDEILAPGPGGGHAWLREHLGDDYIAGWFVARYQDAAVIKKRKKIGLVQTRVIMLSST